MTAQTSPKTEEKLDFKRILPVIFIVFVDLMGLTIIIPILSYYAISFDASPLMIGLLAATYPLMVFIFGPILGALSDRFGRKPVLAIAQVGTFLSLLLLGFANSLWILFLARILDGITGANLPTAQAAITDITTPRTRSQGFGLIGASFGVGFILGPIISALALAFSGNNYSAPAFVAAGFAFVSVMLTTFMFKETLPKEKRGHSQGHQRGVTTIMRMMLAVRQPVVGVLFVIIFVQQLIFGAFQSMFSPFTLVRLGTNSLGNTLFFVYIGLLLAVVQGGLIGKLTARFGERRLIIAGTAVLSLGLIGMSFTPAQPVPWYSRDALIEELQQQSFVEGTDVTTLEQIELLPPEENKGPWGLIYLLAMMTPIAAGIGMLQPSINSLITQSVSAMEVGGVLGLSAAFLSMANVLGPLWGGAVFGLMAPYAPFMIGGIAVFALVFLAYFRVQQPQRDEQPQVAQSGDAVVDLAPASGD